MFWGLSTFTFGLQRVLFALVLTGVCVGAYAGTAVGTQVDNQAYVSYEIGLGGTTLEEHSEVDVFFVQELTDLSLVYLGSTPQPVASPLQQMVLTYALNHLGNGQESYELSFENQAASEGGDEFDALNPQIYIDDGDELFDANLDTVYDPSQPPPFSGNESKYIFVVIAVPAGLSIGDVANTKLTATAQSPGQNVGQAGYVEAGAGDDGQDLVVGVSGGQQTAELSLVVSNNARVVLTKVLSDISDLDGGARPLPGAVVTYRIDVSYTGEGLLETIAIADAIPDHSNYVVGSLLLDGQSQTDIADTDSAEFDSQNNQVLFGLGDVIAPHAAQQIQFKVTIK